MLSESNNNVVGCLEFVPRVCPGADLGSIPIVANLSQLTGRKEDKEAGDSF